MSDTGMVVAGGGGGEGKSPDTTAVQKVIDNSAAKAKATVSKGLAGICKIAAKHLPLAIGVYAMGYFNFSLAWIVGLVGITAATEQWRKEKNFRMRAARSSALYDDKEVIMASVSDLPSWVSHFSD